MALLQKFLYVYIIQCSDDSYYTGVTHSLYDRYLHHEQGVDPRSYTFRRRPFKCVYWEIYESPLSAIYREKQIKRWSHAKKKALVQGDIELLRSLSKKSF